MEDGVDESLGEAEFLLENEDVSGQTPSGFKCQDEKETLGLSGNEELLELLELRMLDTFGGLGILAWQWTIKLIKSPAE